MTGLRGVTDTVKRTLVAAVAGLLIPSMALAQVWPGGGYGSGSSYCTFQPGMLATWGQDPPKDANGKPTMAPACNMPAEYDCPLFENRPHDGLNQAIDALMTVMTITPECKELGASATLVSDNAGQLRDALQKLQVVMNNPESTPVDPSEVQRNITVAINSATIMGQVFSNNAIVNSKCGKAMSGTGGTLLAINDLLNNLSPYALMAAAVAPGIGLATKFAITGGALATSAISTVVNLVNQGQLDMNNPQHRRAVLKNTCLFTKIARKVHFMQLAQSGQIQTITSDLEKHLNSYKARFANTPDDLQKQITYRDGLEQQASVVETQMRKDNFELSALEMETKQYQDDELSLCLRAQDLVQHSTTQPTNSGVWSGTTTTAMIFPMSIVMNLAQASCISKGGTLSGAGSFGSFGTSDPSACQLPQASNQWPPIPGATPSPLQPIPNAPATGSSATDIPGNVPTTVGQTGTANPPAPGSTIPAIGQPTDPNAFPPSPLQDATSMQDAQVTSLKTMNGLARQRLAALVPKVMENDPNAIHYCAGIAKTWFRGLRTMFTLTGQLVNSERTTIDDEMSKDPEFAAWKEQSDSIKAEEKTISRVARVMKELAKDDSVIDRSELDQRMGLLKGALFGIRGSWTLNSSPIEQWLKHTMKLHTNRIASFNENVRQLVISSSRLASGYSLENGVYAAGGAYSYQPMNNDLKDISLERIQIGTRGHELACQLLETTWLDWSAGIDHLGASEFMCDLIDDYIDNKVEKKISAFCRGEVGFDSKQITASELQKARNSLTTDTSNSGKSARDWALLVGKKLQELQCPMPPVTVMN